jgi:hypothetical protein
MNNGNEPEARRYRVQIRIAPELQKQLIMVRAFKRIPITRIVAAALDDLKRYGHGDCPMLSFARERPPVTGTLTQFMTREELSRFRHLSYRLKSFNEEPTQTVADTARAVRLFTWWLARDGHADPVRIDAYHVLQEEMLRAYEIVQTRDRKTLARCRKRLEQRMNQLEAKYKTREARHVEIHLRRIRRIRYACAFLDGHGLQPWSKTDSKRIASTSV